MKEDIFTKLANYAQYNNGLIPIDHAMSISAKIYYSELGQREIAKEDIDYIDDRSDVKDLGIVEDYITASHLGPLFSLPLSRWLVEKWFYLQQKGLQKFIWLEMGPGEGQLFQQIWDHTYEIPGFHNSISHIIFLEFSNILAKKQRNIVEYCIKNKNSSYNSQYDNISTTNFIHCCNIDEVVNNLKKIKLPTIGFANEFFDALPIKQFYKSSDKIHEVMLKPDLKTKSFNLVLSKFNNNENFNYYKNIPENGIVEISPVSDYIIDNLSFCYNILPFFSLLCIDYGYWDPLFASTIQAIHFHKKLKNPFNYLGNADISSLVDFFSLKQVFFYGSMQKYNIKNNKDHLSKDISEITNNDTKNYLFLTQKEFLLKYGINEFFKQIKNKLLLFDDKFIKFNKINKNLSVDSTQQNIYNDRISILKRQKNRLIDINKMGNLFKFLCLSWDNSDNSN
ncbi:SAM-dependent methyltransferase [Lyticum sinuosum]|uniref:SAM-dependent methyltransferase n=1 Tax=Lyticum sinuosum TaxID=1332059 RepID=A0AAE4VM39_9RICK|nr:SAM-dependent methyltransferase [Lyticum sinuosum]MDZ5761124.1 SAM-dependent methyltransferase [Lyticum sinuosum]